MEKEKKEAGYARLEIYQRARRLAVEIHRMSLTLPKFEMYEEGGQIRRSSNSVAAQIVEGYCLRKNKKEFVQYLDRAYASAHETLEHLLLLDQSGSLSNKSEFEKLYKEYETLCRMIFRFIEAVLEQHEKPGFVREMTAPYDVYPTSFIPNLTSD